MMNEKRAEKRMVILAIKPLYAPYAPSWTNNNMNDKP